MKKVVIAILLLFVIGVPPSLKAVHPVSEAKISLQSRKSLKDKKHKRPFLQRVILKKIQRKLDRKIRKKTKRRNKLANKSLGFGLGSILVLGVEFLVAINLPLLGTGLFFLFLLGFNLTAFLFGVKGVSNGIRHLRKNRNDSTIKGERKGDWKTTIGIVFGAIGVLISAVIFILGILIISYYG